MDLIDFEAARTVAQRRDMIVALEAAMPSQPGALVRADFDHKHYHAPGVYAREILLRAGTCVTGKVHLFDHLNFVLGDVTEFTPFGKRRITGQETFVAPAGTKRALLVHADTWWTTIHANPTNATDIDGMDALFTASTFEGFDGFLLESQDRMALA